MNTDIKSIKPNPFVWFFLFLFQMINWVTRDLVRFVDIPGSCLNNRAQCNWSCKLKTHNKNKQTNS